MRRRSKKQAKLYKDNRDWRESFLREIGHCMMCGGQAECVDEILPGKNRSKCFCDRRGCLALCWLCNDERSHDKVAVKLVYKLLHDPFWFDLDFIRSTYDTGQIGRSPGELVNCEDIRTEAIRLGLYMVTR